MCVYCAATGRSIVRRIRALDRASTGNGNLRLFPTKYPLFSDMSLVACLPDREQLMSLLDEDAARAQELWQLFMRRTQHSRRVVRSLFELFIAKNNI